jgi:hypothetical protein
LDTVHGLALKKIPHNVSGIGYDAVFRRERTFWGFQHETAMNRLTPELNPYAQRCLTIFFTGGFAS